MTDRRVIFSGAAWEPVVGYSRAVLVGSWVSVAGTTAAQPRGGAVGGNDPAEQTREAIRRIAAALEKVGAGLEHVVRTRMFVTDIRPASSVVQVSALIDPALLVEVEADADLLGGVTRRESTAPISTRYAITGGAMSASTGP